MSFNIEVEAGKSVRLPTAGTYCDRDIVVTASGASEEELQSEYDLGWRAGYGVGWDGGYADGQVDADRAICEDLEVYSNDRVTTVIPYAFTYRNFREVYLPALTDAIGGSVFSNCPKLQWVEMPRYAGRNNGYFFFNNPQLVFVDFGYAERVCSKAFRKCTRLGDLILRREELTTLVNGNAFDAIQWTVKIYVPEALIREYENATNWCVLCAYGVVSFHPIEGSDYS